MLNEKEIEIPVPWGTISGEKNCCYDSQLIH